MGIRHTLPLSVVALLAACSGGVFGGATPPAVPPNAQSTLSDQGRSWTFPTTGSDVDEFAYVANGGNSNYKYGISAYSINASSGALKPVRGSPFGTVSFFISVAVDPKGKFLFGTGPGYYSGVYAFKMESSGALKTVAGSPFPAGEVPTAVAVEPRGKFAYVVNDGFGGNNITASIIERPSGALKPVRGSPFGTGDAPDAVAADPSGKFLYVLDYAGHDVRVYSIDATSGALTHVSRTVLKVRKRPLFPEDLAIDPAGKFLYVTCGYVCAFKIGRSGTLTEITGSPFQAGHFPYGVTVDPTGKFVYVTNYVDLTVSAFTIKHSGALTPVAGSPFATGSETGPVAVAVDPTDNFAYISDAGVFKIMPSGALSLIAGSEFPSDADPSSIAICRVHAGTGACLPRPL